MTQVSGWYWLHGLSPLHVGAGEGVGAIDLPIMREKVTEWPFIPGSSVKGVQRDYYRLQHREEKWLKKVFGTGGDQDASAGSLVMTDGRILAFPVASRYGTFAYVTCPLVLKRFQRDAHASGLQIGTIDPEELDEFERQNASGVQAWITDSSVIKSVNAESETVHLDEFEGTAKANTHFTEWVEKIGAELFRDASEQRSWQARVVLVSDDTFQYFATMCCEVEARIRISMDTKTVEKGALWYEEYVPTEAVFYGIIWCDQIQGNSSVMERKILLEELDKESILQIGGNASVGKGRMRCRLTTGGRPNEVH